MVKGVAVGDSNLLEVQHLTDIEDCKLSGAAKFLKELRSSYFYSELH